MAWKLLQCDERVSAFLAAIGAGAEARVVRDLRKLAEKGNRLRFPHTDSLGDGLFELRTSHGGNIYRNIFIFRGSSIVVLESFMKKTQRTPAKNIRLAKQRREQIDAGEIDSLKTVRH